MILPVCFILCFLHLDASGEVVYSALDSLNSLTGSFLVRFVHTIDVIYRIWILHVDGESCSKVVVQ